MALFSGNLPLCRHKEIAACSGILVRPALAEEPMDEKTLDLLVRAINEGITSTLWTALALAAVAGGAAAYLVSYLTKMGEHRALRDNFSEALDQMKQQTEATKAIETEFGESLHYRTEILFPRLEAYKTLWAATEIVRPTREEAITAEEKKKLRQTLTSWYYDKGNGIFLSFEAGRHFREARAALDEKTDGEIKRLFSMLRETLKSDVRVYEEADAKVDLGT